MTPAQAKTFSCGHWQQPPSQPHQALDGAAHDTRKLNKAQMFFALRGVGGDGHDYLPQLIGSSVKLIIADRPVHLPTFKGAILQTKDVQTALADMARGLIKLHRPQVVAITGSHGKTTAKEVIAHVLAAGLKLLKTPGSLNNEIGVPLSLLALNGSHDAVVLEFSARKKGDIAFLCSIAPPKVGVLLNVGHAHLGVFGSQEAIYQTKTELFQHLQPAGTALWGSHDPRLGKLARSLCPPDSCIQSFGLEQGDFSITNLQYNHQGCQQFTAVHQQSKLSLQSGILGPFGALPLLAAWGVCRALNLPDHCVQQADGWAPQQPGRLQLAKSTKHAMLIDDTYNASPETIAALAQTLKLRPEPRKILVLGPLSELEEDLKESVELIAKQLPGTVTGCLVYEPQETGFAASLKAAAPQTQVASIASQDELIQTLHNLDAPDCVIGFKGARSSHMERFVLAMQGVKVGCQRMPCSWLRRCVDCPLLKVAAEKGSPTLAASNL